jgi:DNA-binding CsgD family transcriptional regulator
MRKGDQDAPALLIEAGEKAFATMELQYIIPALIALLQCEWLTGKSLISQEDIDHTIEMIPRSINKIDNNELAFWLWKVRNQLLPLEQVYEGYDAVTVPKAQNAAALWEKLGCPYVHAILLFEGTDDDKRKAITIMQELGASASYEKMKLEMRGSGIKKIPRGIRKATQSNPALLTDRELDVLQLLPEGLQNKEIAARLFISVKTVDHHISAILYKLEVNSRVKAVQEATKLGIIK